MAKTDRKSLMVCPCCGLKRAIESLGCDHCGARRVGDPLPAPDLLKPRLGAAFTAFGCALLIVLAFAAVWLLGNDLKVARVLLVWAIGDGTEFTRRLIEADRDLPIYRIFTYDAYRLAFFLSFGLIPLSLAGMWLARRALRLARREPMRFGGLKLARASLALSMFLFLSFSAAAISSIPRALKQGEAKRIAETNARLYQLHGALTRYYREHGTYPPRMDDLLQEEIEKRLPTVDYWDQAITYVTSSVVASKGSVPFSNYELRSPGPDGIHDTADDIVMRDGVIEPVSAETALPTGLLPPEKTPK
jgi:hypothetical protein